MKCETIQNNLIFYIDKELDNQVMLDIETHLKNCDECLAIYKKLNNVYGYKTEKLDVQEFYFSDLKKRMDKEKNHMFLESKNNVFLVKKLLVAAVLVIGLFIGVLMGNYYNNVEISQNPTEIENEVFDNDSYETAFLE